MEFIITLTGTLLITGTTIIDHIDTITIVIINALIEALTIIEGTELQQLLEEVTLLVVEELQLQDVLLMFTEEVMEEPTAITLALQEIREAIIQEEETVLTIEASNDQLEQEGTTLMVIADLLVATKAHHVLQEAQEEILELLTIIMFVDQHLLETLEAILKESKVLIDLLENRLLREAQEVTQSQPKIAEKIMLRAKAVTQENLEVTQNLLKALVVIQLHQEALEVILLQEVAQEEVAEAHQEVLEDNLKTDFKISF